MIQIPSTFTVHVLTKTKREASLAGIKKVWLMYMRQYYMF